jgi:hypothetical protein
MTILTFLGTLLAIIPGAVKLYRYVYDRGFSKAKAEFAASRLRQRYERLYAPMAALFITRHVTTYRVVMAPYLRQRIRHTIKALLKWQVLTALHALGDRCETKELAEIEFGGPFPMSQISGILRGNEAFADNALLEFVRRADRSRYEREGEDGLTDEEFELFRHIAKTEIELNALFNPTDT